MGERPRLDSDAIRYAGKAVDDEEWIVDFLNEQETGVIALANEGTPHPVTQLFVYDDREGAIFVHGARDGRAYGIVDGDGESRASFTTSRMGRYVPADEPVNFTVEYASVVAYGSVSLLDGAGEKRRVLERFMSKFAPHLTPGEEYAEISEESIDRTAVYRLDVERWSAKRGEKPPDQPGAYELEDVRESE